MTSSTFELVDYLVSQVRIVMSNAMTNYGNYVNVMDAVCYLWPEWHRWWIDDSFMLEDEVTGA
jgi:hypothetical protein